MFWLQKATYCCLVFCSTKASFTENGEQRVTLVGLGESGFRSTVCCGPACSSDNRQPFACLAEQRVISKSVTQICEEWSTAHSVYGEDAVFATLSSLKSFERQPSFRAYKSQNATSCAR